ncbi:MAG: glycosyltransferase [Nanoarchaeota archaeon]|nr:glycosyltransferase [Nanoarchaeota archaeon]
MAKKILVINKRFTSGNDTVGTATGRTVELHKFMNSFNSVIYSFDLKKKEYLSGKINNKVRYVIRPFSLLSLRRSIKDVLDFSRKENVDFILATNNPIFGYIGYVVAKKLGKPFIYDLMDNYVSYRPKIPFIGLLDNYLIKKADLIVAVSKSLADKVKSNSKRVVVIENGVDEKFFYPMKRESARTKLKLPLREKFVLYSGGIERNRGIPTLLRAMELLRKDTDVKLYFVGPITDKYPFDESKGVFYLGKTERSKVNLYLNSANLLVLPNTNNEFTRYCFPLKLLEYISTDKPIVATKVGDVPRILRGYSDSLCEPGNSVELARKMKINLQNDKSGLSKLAKVYSWKILSNKLESAIRGIKK